MTDRGASASVIAEIGKSNVSPFHLFELYLDVGDGGTIYNSDAVRTISWSGHSYLANGEFMSFSGIQESQELRVKTCTVTLSGVDQAYIATVLTVKYIDRRLVIRKGFFDTTDTAIVDPIAIFDGHVSDVAIDEDPTAGSCSVTLAASDQFVAFERLVGRHTNLLEQQLLFAADKGLQYVSAITAQIKWGQA